MRELLPAEGFRDNLVLLFSRDSGKSKSPRNLLPTIIFFITTPRFWPYPFPSTNNKKAVPCFSILLDIRCLLLASYFPLRTGFWVGRNSGFFFDVVFGFSYFVSFGAFSSLSPLDNDKGCFSLYLIGCCSRGSVLPVALLLARVFEGIRAIGEGLI
ncbi:hypothetical protein VNO78_23222 [Psophocarpus tetragonolobus]|uniref:Uncharacterized protein n=1 Tax=Psophocarpus tetragonolobus TaxID=3891 RepID=A0AAN9S4I9_PSOTE